MSKIVLDAKRGKLTVIGKGVGTGGETTDPDYVPVVVACAELRLAASVSDTQKSKGILYKAPRR